jgi:hypothetical protein
MSVRSRCHTDINSGSDQRVSPGNRERSSSNVISDGSAAACKYGSARG